MDDEQPPAWFVAIEQRIKIGDRVRVRLNPECDYCGGDKSDGKVATVQDTEHRPQYRGYDEDFASHHYWILMDDPPPNFSGWGHFAATELELLDN